MSRFLNYPQAMSIFELIKLYVDNAVPQGMVESVSINNGTPIKPDNLGNINLTINDPDMSNYVARADTIWLQTLYGKENWAFGMLIGDSKTDPLVTKSYVDNKIPDLTNIIKTVSVNGGQRVGPDNSGNANLDIPTYTLELDNGEANITASIDNGDPVSKDSNDNINLNVPDKYIDTVAGWGKTFTNVNNPLYDEDGNAIPHTINLGFIGKPRFYADISSNPAFRILDDPKFVYIEAPSDGIVELNGFDDEYVKITNRMVVEIKGNVWCFKANYGVFGDGFFIGAQKGFTIDILSLGSLSSIKICTGVEQTQYGTSGVFEYVNLKPGRRTLLLKDGREKIS